MSFGEFQGVLADCGIDVASGDGKASDFLTGFFLRSSSSNGLQDSNGNLSIDGIAQSFSASLRRRGGQSAYETTVRRFVREMQTFLDEGTNLHRALLPLQIEVATVSDPRSPRRDTSDALSVAFGGVLEQPTLVRVLLRTDDSSIQPAVLDALLESLQSLDGDDVGVVVNSASFHSSVPKLILNHLRFLGASHKLTPLVLARKVVDAARDCDVAIAARVLEDLPAIGGVNDPSASGYVLQRLKDIIVQEPDLTVPALHAATNLTYSSVAVIEQNDADSASAMTDDTDPVDVDVARPVTTSTAVLVAAMIERALASSPAHSLPSVIALALEHTAASSLNSVKVTSSAMNAVVQHSERDAMYALLRSVRKTLAAEWGRGGSRSSRSSNTEMEILEAIHDRTQILPQFRSTLVAELARATTTADHSSADVWLLFLLVGVGLQDAGASATMGDDAAMKLLRSKVKSGLVSVSLLRRCIKANTPAMLLPHVWTACIHVAKTFLAQRAAFRARTASGGTAHDQATAIQSFGQEIYICCFESLALLNARYHVHVLQNIVAHICEHVTAHITTETDGALDVLVELSENRSAVAGDTLATFAVLIKGIVHTNHLPFLSDEQTRKAFRVLTALSIRLHKNGDSMEDDNLTIYVQKMLSDTSESIQRVGVIAGVAMLRVFAASSNDDRPHAADQVQVLTADRLQVALEPLLEFLEKTSVRQQRTRSSGGRAQLNKQSLAERRTVGAASTARMLGSERGRLTAGRRPIESLRAQTAAMIGSGAGALYALLCDEVCDALLSLSSANNSDGQICDSASGIFLKDICSDILSSCIVAAEKGNDTQADEQNDRTWFLSTALNDGGANKVDLYSYLAAQLGRVNGPIHQSPTSVMTIPPDIVVALPSALRLLMLVRRIVPDLDIGDLSNVETWPCVLHSSADLSHAGSMLRLSGAQKLLDINAQLSAHDWVVECSNGIARQLTLVPQGDPRRSSLANLLQRRLEDVDSCRTNIAKLLGSTAAGSVATPAYEFAVKLGLADGSQTRLSSSEWNLPILHSAMTGRACLVSIQAAKPEANSKASHGKENITDDDASHDSDDDDDDEDDNPAYRMQNQAGFVALRALRSHLRTLDGLAVEEGLSQLSSHGNILNLKDLSVLRFLCADSLAKLRASLALGVVSSLVQSNHESESSAVQAQPEIPLAQLQDQPTVAGARSLLASMNWLPDTVTGKDAAGTPCQSTAELIRLCYPLSPQVASALGPHVSFPPWLREVQQDVKSGLPPQLSVVPRLARPFFLCVTELFRSVKHDSDGLACSCATDILHSYRVLLVAMGAQMRPVATGAIGVKFSKEVLEALTECLENVVLETVAAQQGGTELAFDFTQGQRSPHAAFAAATGNAAAKSGQGSLLDRVFSAAQSLFEFLRHIGASAKLCHSELAIPIIEVLAAAFNLCLNSARSISHLEESSVIPATRMMEYSRDLGTLQRTLHSLCWKFLEEDGSARWVVDASSSAKNPDDSQRSNVWKSAQLEVLFFGAVLTADDPLSFLSEFVAPFPPLWQRVVKDLPDLSSKRKLGLLQAIDRKSLGQLPAAFIATRASFDALEQERISLSAQSGGTEDAATIDVSSRTHHVAVNFWSLTKANCPVFFKLCVQLLLSQFRDWINAVRMPPSLVHDLPSMCQREELVLERCAAVTQLLHTLTHILTILPENRWLRQYTAKYFPAVVDGIIGVSVPPKLRKSGPRISSSEPMSYKNLGEALAAQVHVLALEVVVADDQAQISRIAKLVEAMKDDIQLILRVLDRAVSDYKQGLANGARTVSRSKGSDKSTADVKSLLPLATKIKAARGSLFDTVELLPSSTKSGRLGLKILPLKNKSLRGVAGATNALHDEPSDSSDSVPESDHDGRAPSDASSSDESSAMSDSRPKKRAHPKKQSKKSAKRPKPPQYASAQRDSEASSDGSALD